MRKLNLLKKTENKVLLELIAVYAVLALALTGVYYLDPIITGFAISNVTDEIPVETVEVIDETISVESILNETTDETETAVKKTAKEKPDKTEKDDKPEKTGPNTPPVWEADIGSLTVNGKTAFDLNDYFTDKEDDTITYTSATPDKISVEIDGNLMTLNPDGHNFTSSIEITASDGELYL
jgi:hypothetical protein